MEIYIEEFLLQNILINLCLLRLVELTTKSKTSLFKLILSAVIGSAFSVIAVIVLNNSLMLNIIKFACACLMLIVAFKLSIKQFVFNFILLFTYTFAFGGAITSLSSATYYTGFGFVTSVKINLHSICLILLILTYIIQFAVKHIKFKIKANNLIYKIRLFKNNNSVSINAYLDTGNFLNINGKPVIIVNLETYLKLAKINLIDFYLAKSEQIKTSTVTGCSNLKVFKLDKLEFKINNKKQLVISPYVAVNTQANFKNTNYDALLNPMLF